MKLLFISGKFGSGKTTLADNLYNCKDLNNYTVMTYNFADFPKEAVADILDKDYQYFNINKQEVTEFNSKEGNPLTKRQLMQYLFEDIFCSLNPYIWAHKVYRRILINKKRYCKNQYNECLHIISDWRKVTEYEYLTNKLKNELSDIKTIRLTNSNLDNNDNHISEINLDKFEFDSIIEVSNLNPQETLQLILKEFEKWGW